MTTRIPSPLGWFIPALSIAALLWSSAVPQAQDRAQSKPQAQDDDYARLVKEWTTKPEFLSPLVDHLPKAPGIPTPKDILGYYIGAPKKLTYTADQQRFFKALEKASARVKTFVIGQTEEGRDIMVAFVSSEENIRNLDANRQNLQRLADPRGLTDLQAQDLIARTKPHYHISAALHSSESNTPETVMELSYRLVASDEAFIKTIRDNVIVSIAPSTDVDGRDRFVDWYYAYKQDEPYDNSENFGGPPYWGKYVFHDNNRDINYGVDSLRHHLNWYLHWLPPIWHDLHEAQPFLYTFSGQPPNNENLDPILYSELPFFATYEVNKLTSFGMPGVWHYGFVDTWSPGYLGFAASNHNGMLRMYEIFNVGGATTKKARIGGRPGGDAPTRGPTSREWFRPLPPYAEVDWSIRNSVNYAETALLSALELTSTFPRMVVENFYKKSRHAVAAGQNAAPYAFVLPSGQRDMTRVVRVVNLLRLQAIEVWKATAPIVVTGQTFPEGSFIVKLNQPYGRLAKTLLENQKYPDPALRTYDDSGWTMGLMNNIDVRTIDDAAVLTAQGELLTTDAIVKGTTSGAPTATTYAVMHNGSLGMITLRYRLRDLPVRGATAVFTAGDTEYPAGSFIIAVSGAQGDRVRKEVESLGLTAAALSAAPTVSSVDLDLPRIAVYSTWSATEKVGWVRMAFDRFEVPYTLIHKEQLPPGAALKSQFDVIVIPHQGGSAKGLVFEQPKASKPLPYRKNDTYKSFGMYGESDDIRGGMGLEGVAALAAFVEQGGVLLTLGVASYLPPEFGIARSIDAQRPLGNFYAPGPIVQATLVQTTPETTHPVLYGYDQKTLPVRWADGPLLTVPEPDPGEAADAASKKVEVLMRFPGGDANVLSGLMRGADQIRNRPAIVDASVGRGRVLLYAINPIYRWQTFGEHNLVFNALLFYNDMPAR